MPQEPVLPFMGALIHSAALYWGAAIVVTLVMAVWQAGRVRLDAWTM
jgi:hypothetical protein